MQCEKINPVPGLCCFGHLLHPCYHDRNQQAAVIGDATARMEKLLQQGPVPGIRTFCLYGTQIKTPITLVYDQPLAVGRVMKRPRQVINVEGDGCVDLKSLRLCGR